MSNLNVKNSYERKCIQNTHRILKNNNLALKFTYLLSLQSIVVFKLSGSAVLCYNDVTCM